MCLLFLNRQSSKSGRILILGLKAACVKENKRMAVPSLVPPIIPGLKLVILSHKPWRFQHSFPFRSAESPAPRPDSRRPPHQRARGRALALREAWEAVGQAAGKPTWVLVEGCGPRLPAEPAAARPAWSHSGEACRPPPPGHSPLRGRRSGGSIFITYQRLGGSVI